MRLIAFASLAIVGIAGSFAGQGQVRAQAAPTSIAGKTAFQSCAACHSVQPGVSRLGPSLAGIVGKPAAQAEGFRYSPAMAAAKKLRWDRKTLDAFIAAPRTALPGTTMAFAGVSDPAKRRAIIDYLQSLP